MKTKLEVVIKQATKNGEHTYMVIDDGDKHGDYVVMVSSNAYAEFSDYVTRLAMEFGNFFYVKEYGRKRYA